MGREALVLTTPATAGTKTNKTATTVLAPGFRFHPTDEELVSYYLKRKVSNKPFRFNAIGEVDIYKNEPWDLAVYSTMKSRDQEWYFFGALDKKYGNGARMNRATGNGYWKATGKDREIRRESQLIGMKKTLVFHRGRAPAGQRTNWVMHEYRLVEDELRKLQVGQDSYVLCRIFHKSNVGPPNGNRYAPFIEEEWDEGITAFPGVDAGDDVVAGEDACTEKNGVETVHVELVYTDSQSISKEPLNINELPREVQNDLSMCKKEKEDCPSQCVINMQAPIPLLQYKRRRPNDSVSNRSNDSAETTILMATNSATTTAISALLEFSLMESIDHPKETPCVLPTPFGADYFDSSMPPSCAKLIKDLKKQVHTVADERKTLKDEMRSARDMINKLQSQVDFLSKENDELKRRNKGA